MKEIRLCCYKLQLLTIRTVLQPKYGQTHIVRSENTDLKGHLYWMRSFRNSSPSIWCSHQNKFSWSLITAELSGLPRYTFLHTHSRLWKLSGWCTAFVSAPVVTKKYELQKKRDHRGQQQREHVTLALKMLHWQCLWLHVNVTRCLAGLRSAAPVWAAGGGDLEFQRSNKDNKGL